MAQCTPCRPCTSCILQTCGKGRHRLSGLSLPAFTSQVPFGAVPSKARSAELMFAKDVFEPRACLRMTRTKQWISQLRDTSLHQNLQVNKPRPRPVKTTLSVRACCRLPSCRKAHFLNHAGTSHMRIEKSSFLMLFYGTVCIDAPSVRFSDLSGVQAHSHLSSEGLQAVVVPLLLS